MNSTQKRFAQNLLFLLPVLLLLVYIAEATGQTFNNKQLHDHSNLEADGRQIHPSKAPVGPQKKAEFAKTVSTNRSAGTQESLSSPRKIRFVDNGDGTVTDRKTNLMWIKNGRRWEFTSALTWWDAIDKSRDLKIGGHDNWRLPTIEEWYSLIDTRQQSPAIIEPSPFKNIVTHMPYWTMTEFVYGKNHTCSRDCPFETYTVMLYYGNVGHQRKTARAFILPVRSLD